MQSPGGEIRRGLFLLKFSNRTAAACHDAPTPNARRLRRRRRAVVRTIAGRARANVPARGAGPVARAAAVSGDTEIGFAPETIALRHAICRAFLFRGEAMTAYLISLALAGLVAIVLWEKFS